MIGIIHLSLGGDIYEIQISGRRVTFEDHPYCGPTPINRKTMTPLSTEPTKAFWDAIDRWVTGGKRHEFGVAIVPKWCRSCGGSGHVQDPVLKGKWVTTCLLCGGEKVEAAEQGVGE